jgi:hypothetical protein
VNDKRKGGYRCVNAQKTQNDFSPPFDPRRIATALSSFFMYKSMALFFRIRLFNF